MTSWETMRSFASDDSVTRQRLAPGLARRIARYARPYPVSYTHLTLPTNREV